MSEIKSNYTLDIRIQKNGDGDQILVLLFIIAYLQEIA